MNTPVAFTIVLQQFAALREQANDERHAMEAVAVGDKLLLSAGELMKAGQLANKAPLGIALRRFVKTLPDEQLYALLALMYAGRDKVTDPIAYWKSTIRGTVQSRSAAVAVVLEKEPAADYLRSAIDSLAPHIQLDALPGLVASAR